MRVFDFLILIKDSVIAWFDDAASSLAASIAFYTAFSIAPLLVIIISVAGVVWGQDAVQGEILRQIGGLVGADAAKGIQTLIESADEPAQGIAGTLISLGVLLVGATSVFGELQYALDRVWKVPASQQQGGVWTFIRMRLLSFGLVLGLAFLLLVSLALSAFLGALGQVAPGWMSGSEFLLQLLNTLVSVMIATALFGMIYKFMTKVKLQWRDVVLGAFVTAVLFEIGKVLISLYVGKSASISSIAAAGSLVVFLIWVYYAAMIFLLGAEFTWLYANRFGSRKEQERQGGGAESVAAPAQG
jgi:membrane protein